MMSCMWSRSSVFLHIGVQEIEIFPLFADGVFSVYDSFGLASGHDSGAETRTFPEHAGI